MVRFGAIQGRSEGFVADGTANWKSIEEPARAARSPMRSEKLTRLASFLSPLTHLFSGQQEASEKVGRRLLSMRKYSKMRSQEQTGSPATRVMPSAPNITKRSVTLLPYTIDPNEPYPINMMRNHAL